MKAIIWNGLGAQPALREDMPEPAPGAKAVRVGVHASSVNPVDNGIAAGMVKDMVPHEFPVTLGRDFAGVVEQLGDGVTAVSAGDEVFGFVPAMGPIVHAGSWAELIVVPEAGLTRKPDGVDTAAAGAAPLAAVTAAMCVDALDLSQGDTVLIAGATGGVGSAAAQLAVAAGATVLAPALPEDEQYLRALGVTEVLPRDRGVVAALRERHPDGVDAIVDLVNFAPGTYDAALKNGGRVSSATNAAGEGPGRTNVMAAPSPEILNRIAQHLADGTLKVPIQQTYDLAQAPDALQALGATHTQGKLALRVAPRRHPNDSASSKLDPLAQNRLAPRTDGWSSYSCAWPSSWSCSTRGRLGWVGLLMGWSSGRPWAATVGQTFAGRDGMTANRRELPRSSVAVTGRGRAA